MNTEDKWIVSGMLLLTMIAVVMAASAPIDAQEGAGGGM